MADLLDVATALMNLAAATVYPNGTGQASITGFPIAVEMGWPDPQQLDVDLAAGKAHVSIYPRPEERNTTRYPRDFNILSINTQTVTAVISGQTVTIGGTIPAAGNTHNIEITVNGFPYSYTVLTSDTLTSIAAALTALIVAGVVGTTSTGPVITVPSSARIASARIGVTGTLQRELRRQERLFQITIWAHSPGDREAVAGAVDVALAVIQFITLTDGSAAYIRYKGSPITDNLQKTRLYRRDLLYTVEYATTQNVVGTQVISEQLNIAPQTYDSKQISTAQFNL